MFFLGGGIQILNESTNRWSAMAKIINVFLFFDDDAPCFSSETSHQPYEACSETNVEAPVRLQDSQSPSALELFLVIQIQSPVGRNRGWLFTNIHPFNGRSAVFGDEILIRK